MSSALWTTDNCRQLWRNCGGEEEEEGEEEEGGRGGGGRRGMERVVTAEEQAC